MTFERLKPFFVLAIIAILLIGGKLYYDKQIEKEEREMLKVQNELEYSQYKSRVDSFLNDQSSFRSLDITTLQSNVESSGLSLDLKDSFTNKHTGLIEKCLDKQLTFLQIHCNDANFNTLVREYKNVLKAGDSRNGDVNKILSCIEYLNAGFAADLNSFESRCKQQSKNILNENAWNSLRKDDIYTKIKDLENCVCCKGLRSRVNASYTKWKNENRKMENSYNDLLKSLDKAPGNTGPLDMIIVNRPLFNKSYPLVESSAKYYKLYKSKKFNVINQ